MRMSFKLGEEVKIEKIGVLMWGKLASNASYPKLQQHLEARYLREQV